MAFLKKTLKRSVAAVVFNENHEILLVKRRDVPIWVLPGGGIEVDESPQQAVIREVLEETGLKVGIRRSVAEYSPVNRLANHTFLYECSGIGGDLKTGAESRQVGYFSFDKLPSPFFYIHRDWIEDAKKGHPEVIYKQLDQVTYFQLLKYFCLHPIHVLRFLLSRLGLPINSK